MKVSVIIPTKNEESTLEPVLLGCLKHADEILLIDGHSTDSTREIAARHNIRCILIEVRERGTP